MKIKVLDKFGPAFAKPKPIKILVSGRGATKSTAVCGKVLTDLTRGKRWACGREFLNSIEESVHNDLVSEMSRLNIGGFKINKNNIHHLKSGGRTFYVSLARNVLSLKGKLSGANLWIEEGEGISEETIRIGIPSVRLSAKEVEEYTYYFMHEKNMTRIEAAHALPKPEVWITMNRGSREDPIAKYFLSRAEDALAASGYYEDDELMVIQASYEDVPKSWWIASGLETKRAADEKNLPLPVYLNKWHGHYLETIENAMIQEKWFDACIDAHLVLGFEPAGIEVVAHDPSDLGPDPKGLCYRHGSVIMDLQLKKDGDLAEGGTWALDYALEKKPDLFVWDAEGMGVGLREKVVERLRGKTTRYAEYHGGHGVTDPDEEVGTDDHGNSITNKMKFYNRRAQDYYGLAERMRRTWEAVNKISYYPPEQLISFNSKMELLGKLRSEICRLPLDKGSKLKLLPKDKMLSMYKIPSPNLADSVKMSLCETHTEAAGALNSLFNN